MVLDNFDTTMGFAAVMLLLSLLITVLVQMVVTALNLRGLNLLWGVRTLLMQIDPRLGDAAKKIANAVLKHKTVCHTWRRTTAIHPEELARLVVDVVENADKHKVALPQNADLVNLVKAASPGITSQQAGQALQVVQEIGKLFPQQIPAVTEAVNRALKSTSELEQRINTWFDTVMDRTTERFVAHTRIATIAFGFLVAFVLHIDSIHIVRELSANKELRGAFVSIADATLKQAEETQETLEESVLASKVIIALATDAAGAEQAATLKTVPSSVRTRAEGLAWIALKFPDDARRADLMLGFSNGYQRASLERVKELTTTAQDIRNSLEERLIKLTPPLPTWTKEHILGFVITALFLSLGAPFWFNVLRNLSNLRPAIAAKVEGRAAA